MNISQYSQIEYLEKVSISWYFGEEFLHFEDYFLIFFRILRENVNYFVDYLGKASLLGKSLFVGFGIGFLGFCKSLSLLDAGLCM